MASKRASDLVMHTKLSMPEELRDVNLIMKDAGTSKMQKNKLEVLTQALITTKDKESRAKYR